MRIGVWLLSAAGIIALTGCGGGGAGAASGSGAPSDAPLTFGTARFKVDATTGKVAVEPLNGNKLMPDGRAIYTGGSLTFTTAELVNDPGNLGRKRVSVKIRNNTNETIGVNGLRLVFTNIMDSDVPGYDSRSLVNVSTIGGNGTAVSTEGNALAAGLMPSALAVSPDGAVVFGESNKIRLLKNNYISTLRSSLSTVSGVAYAKDPVRNTEFALFSESSGHRIRWVNLATASMNTLAGTGVAGDAVGAPGSSQFSSPHGVAIERVDAAGGSLLVADRQNGKVKRIDFTWGNGGPTATTVAVRYSGLTTPTGVAVASNGNIGVTEQTVHRVKIFPGGGSNSVTLGTGSSGPSAGLGSTATFASPAGITFVGETAFVMSTGAPLLQWIAQIPSASPIIPQNWLVGFAAGTASSGFVDGSGINAQFQNSGFGLANDGGNLFISDLGNNRIRKVVSNSTEFNFGTPVSSFNNQRVILSNATGEMIDTFWGGKPYIRLPQTIAPKATVDGGSWDFLVPADVSRFSFTLVVEADTDATTPADIVFNETPGPGSPNAYVRSFIASSPLSVDGVIGQATLSGPRDFTFDSKGAMYLLDASLLRRFDPKKETVTTIVGVRGDHSTVDGLSPVARLQEPYGIAVTPDGNYIYITQANHVVRVIGFIGTDDSQRNDPSYYRTSTILGSINTAGVANGIGTNSRLTSPFDLAYSDSADMIFVAADNPDIGIIRYLGGDRFSPSAYHLQYEFATITGTRPFEIATDNVGRVYYTSGDGANGPSLFEISVPFWSYNYRVVAADTDLDSQSGGGNATKMKGLAVDRNGIAWFVSEGSINSRFDRVRRALPAGGLGTVAGGTLTGSDDVGDRTILTAVSSRRGALAPNGDYYFSDGGRLRYVQRVIRQ